MQCVHLEQEATIRGERDKQEQSTSYLVDRVILEGLILYSVCVIKQICFKNKCFWQETPISLTFQFPVAWKKKSISSSLVVKIFFITIAYNAIIMGLSPISLVHSDSIIIYTDRKNTGWNILYKRCKKLTLSNCYDCSLVLLELGPVHTAATENNPSLWQIYFGIRWLAYVSIFNPFT